MALLTGVQSIWRELTVGPGTYPVFRQEIAYWDGRLGGRWRLGEYLALLSLANLCLLPATLLFFPNLLVLYAILDELLVLAVMLPASILVIRDREAGTWNLLRVTPLSSMQLARAKLAAVLYLGWEGASYIVKARWLGTLFTAPLFVLVVLLPGSRLAGAHAPPLAAAAVLAAAYLLFVYRPFINLLFGGAFGLAASTLSKTRAGAVTLSVLVAIGGALAHTGFMFWYGSAANAGDWLGEGVLAGVLEQAFARLLPTGMVALARLLLAPALFWAAVHRVGRQGE